MRQIIKRILTWLMGMIRQNARHTFWKRGITEKQAIARGVRRFFQQNYELRYNVMKQTEEFRQKNVTAAREKIPASREKIPAARENVAAPLRNLSHDYLLHAFGESHVSADTLCSQLGIIAVEADKRGVWESCGHLFEWETDDDGRVETYAKLQ